MQRFARAIAVVVATAMLSAFTLAPQAGAQEPATIAEIAASNEDLSTLVTALGAASESGPANFLATISNPSADLTVFAPTNAAFAALGETLDAALADPSGLLTQVLGLHVAGAAQGSSDLVAAGSVSTINGASLTIESRDGGVFINGTTQVVVADIAASNGVIHVIDAVLLPAAGAPADDDPADDPAGELPEQPAAGPEAQAGAAAPAAPAQTIGEIAIATPDLSTLVTAVQAASASGGTDFLGAITDPDAALTVFAPTNSAFAALGGTLDAALADPAGLLTEVLAYHVLGTAKSFSNLTTQSSFITMQGQSIEVLNVEGAYKVSGAGFLITDIQASNGVVHVIDTVMLPEMEPEQPATAGSFSVSASAPAAAAATTDTAATATTAAATTTSGAMPLANTGQESTPLFLIAAGLVMLGALVLLVRDRHELALVTTRIASKRDVEPFSWPNAPKMPDHSTFSDAYEHARKD